MTLTDTRLVYKPFEYPQFYDYFLLQHQSHWLHTEVNMTPDVQCYNHVLNDKERNIIRNILKLFTQTEIFVNEYWSTKITKWFPKPEVQMMASAFSAMEGVHTVAYAFLNDTLGIPEAEYSAFLVEPSMKAKVDNLISLEGNTKEDIALSLAVFSGFVEGVSLFSSFAALLSYHLQGKMIGVSNIIKWSIRDESLHSKAGCELFRIFIKEHPSLWNDTLKQKIYQAARDVVALEDDFIDKVFELGDLPFLSAADLKCYVRHRANAKLGDLGLKKNWKNLEPHKMNFVDFTTSNEHTNFFEVKNTSYTKGLGDYSSDDFF